MAIDPDAEALFADAALSAHLATAVDGRPHVAPVWYVYEDGVVWILTGGKKLANLRENPRVALSIESYDAAGVDWGVQLLGTARVVDDEERYHEVARRMDEKYGGDYGTDGGVEGALVAVRVGSASAQTY